MSRKPRKPTRSRPGRPSTTKARQATPRQATPRQATPRQAKRSSERLVYGLGPLEELVNKRANRIVRILVRAGARGRLQELAETAIRAGLEVHAASAAELDQLAGPNAVHQGAIAICGPFQYASLEELIDAPSQGPLVVLDGVTDPHNLGAICRSAYLLGAAGLVIGRDRAASITPVVTKASAGSSEHLAITSVTNIARTLEELRDHDIWRAQIAATEHSQPITDIDSTRRWALVLGAEGRGLRPLVARKTDQAFVIPMAAGGVGSFNVSVATALALYELTRHRRAAQP